MATSRSTDKLAGLAAMLDSVTDQEADLLAALATSTVAQALTLRSLPAASCDDQEDQDVKYKPHPIDVLVFAAIEQEGSLQQADLLAVLHRDTYISRGKSRRVTAGTLRKRLPELIAARALAKTPAGYIVDDSSCVDVADCLLSGDDQHGDEYVPHPLDVLVFAALDQDGAMGQAELLAALASDTYTSQGRDRAVSAGTLKRRLPELVAAGALVKTAGGYAVRDRAAVDQADATF